MGLFELKGTLELFHLYKYVITIHHKTVDLAGLHWAVTTVSTYGFWVGINVKLHFYSTHNINL